jgi:hypothetical protein
MRKIESRGLGLMIAVNGARVYPLDKRLPKMTRARLSKS